MSLFQNTKPHYLWLVSILTSSTNFLYTWFHSTDIRYSVNLLKNIQQSLTQVETLFKCHVYNNLTHEESVHIRALYVHLMHLIQGLITQYG